MAPEPLLPEVSTPVKLTTVIEEATLWDNVAVIETLFRFVDVKARQTSDVPACTLVLTTSSQVKPAPETLVTVVPGPAASVEIKASNNSLPDKVDNPLTVNVDAGGD